jgi:glycine/D-amino acid oxidase-like deaminating enzyme
MLDRAIARGARVVQTDITELDTSGRRTLINAAGPYARELAQSWGGDLPLETVLRQKVVVRDLTRAIPRDAPFTITLDGRSIPWSAADRKRLGASAEGRRLLKQLPVGIHVKPDDSAGPDALKIGWAWDQRPVAASDDPRVPPDFPRMVQLAASTFIPALAPDLPVVAHEGGFYARTPDGRPLIGAVDVDRFVVAGFAGFGAMMACAAGELAAALITGTDVDAATAAAFDPRRFDDATYLEAIGAGKVVTGEL